MAYKLVMLPWLGHVYTKVLNKENVIMTLKTIIKLNKGTIRLRSLLETVMAEPLDVGVLDDFLRRSNTSHVKPVVAL